MNSYKGIKSRVAIQDNKWPFKLNSPQTITVIKLNKELEDRRYVEQKIAPPQWDRILWELKVQKGLKGCWSTVLCIEHKWFFLFVKYLFLLWEYKAKLMVNVPEVTIFAGV